MAAFAIKFAPAAMSIVLGFACTGWLPAQAGELREVTLVPTSQKLSSNKKIAYASAKWLSVKSDRDAQVIIAESDSSTAIRVLSGSVVLRNLFDRSVIRLSAGMGYEFDYQPDVEKRAPAAFIKNAAEAIALFESRSNTSYLYRMADAKFRAEIINPPTLSSYLLGDTAATKLPMPKLVSMHFPPAGVVVWHPPVPALAGSGEAN